MAADPNSFDYFKTNEPLSTVKTAVDIFSFDYFKMGEPLFNMVISTIEDLPESELDIQVPLTRVTSSGLRW